MDLFEEIDNDLLLTPTNITDKIYNVPQLHSKYLRLYFKEKAKLNKYEAELSKLFKCKYIYYTQEYAKLPENQKEVMLLINGDDEYNAIYLKVENQKLMVDVLDRTVKKVNYLSNDCKNIINMLSYYAGV